MQLRWATGSRLNSPYMLTHLAVTVEYGMCFLVCRLPQTPL
jgi:hypothetical protein